MATKEYLCIYPFIQVENPVSIFGVTLNPATDSYFEKFDEDQKRLVRKVQSQLALAGGLMDKFSIALLPSDVSDSDLVSSLKKIADLLRFKLSYNDDFDYDQGLFIVVITQNDGSIKISINGHSPTILDSENFNNKIWSISGQTLSLSENDLPPHALALRFTDKGLRSPNEDRLWRSLDWYSKSFIKDNGIDDQYEIVCLAIAFESLLNLPMEGTEKSFTSYVSNFFGDLPELVWWAADFYNLRSRIVHGNSISLERNLQSSKTKRKDAPSPYYLPLDTQKEFIKTVEIARPIFRDLVEAFSLIQKKKKQYNYEDTFFTDEKRLCCIENSLKNFTNGFEDEDQHFEIGLRVQELRNDGTADVGQLQRISELLLHTLLSTFRSTNIEEDLDKILQSCKAVKKKESTFWDFCKSSKQEFLKLLERKDGLPFREKTVISFLSGEESISNLNEETIAIAVSWFVYAENEAWDAKH